MSSRSRLVLGGVAVVLAVVLLGRLDGASSSAGDPVLGRSAPTVSGTTLDGQEFQRSTWTGRTTIVNVWASWCGPCREELPRLAAFAEEAGPGVDVVTLDTRDGPAAARSLLEETGAQHLLAVQDRDGRMAVDWGATGVPETFVVGPDGKIRARVRGGVTQAWLEQQVTS